MTSMTTTTATVAMPTTTSASTARTSGASTSELLVQRDADLDQLLALGPQVRDGLAVDLLGHLAQLGQRGVRHRIHLHAGGGDLLEQLVVVPLALGALPQRGLFGGRQDRCLDVAGELREDGTADEERDGLVHVARERVILLNLGELLEVHDARRILLPVHD